MHIATTCSSKHITPVIDGGTAFVCTCIIDLYHALIAVILLGYPSYFQHVRFSTYTLSITNSLLLYSTSYYIKVYLTLRNKATK